MRIRLKLSIVELSMALGFFIAAFVSLFYLNAIVRVKNMEYQAERVVSSLASFNNKTAGLLTHAQPLPELKDDLILLVSQFESELEKLKQEDAVRILGDAQIEEFSDVDRLWDELSSQYLGPVLDQLDAMIASGFGEGFGSQGVLFAFYSDENVSSKLKSSVLTLNAFRNNLEGKSKIFSNNLDAFITGLQNQSEQFISNSPVVVMILVGITILFSILLINITATRISFRIRSVEEAVQTLAHGDFSKTLEIKSGDEFEELAGHYNTFKGELWKKLDSILEFMLQIGESLSEGVDINNALDHILDSFIKNTSADAGAAFIVDEEQQFADLVALNGFFPCPFSIPEASMATRGSITEYLRKHPIAIGETIIGQSIRSGKGIFLKESRQDRSMSQNTVKGSLQYIHSIAVIPLVISQRVLGAVALVKTTEELAFTDMEFTNMKTFGDYAALAIDNMYSFTEAVQRREMQRELRIASDIQRNLLPGKLPEMRGYEVAVHTESARAMSGDYYDIYRLDKNRIALVICDVVGKGVPASLLMVMIRTVIRFISSPRRSVDDILNVLNKGITKRIGTDQYATLSVTVLNEVTGEISFSNAGHSPLLYFSGRESTFTQIDTAGLPVGVETNEEYTKKDLKISKNDILVLYTDGLPETFGEDGTLYSLDRLKEVIEENCKKRSEEIVNAVEADLAKFKGIQDLKDDQTLIVVKVL